MFGSAFSLYGLSSLSSLDILVKVSIAEKGTMTTAILTVKTCNWGWLSVSEI